MDNEKFFANALFALVHELGEELSTSSSTQIPEGYARKFLEDHEIYSRPLKEKGLLERMEKHIESRFYVGNPPGHMVKDDDDFEPWYSLRLRVAEEGYYWSRLKTKWYEERSLPVKVIHEHDRSTNEVLDRLGDPSKNSWHRKGMVMGYVQSGKTTNYAALVTKAADAGYKIIIVLAGLTEALRRQTQERLDQDFVGRSSVVTLGAENVRRDFRHPDTITDTLKDFKRTALQLKSEPQGSAEPMFFVVKKNKSVLDNLATYLQEMGSSSSMLKGPMLIIDDEADNATVNTNDPEKDPTAINRGIRNIIATCSRTSYVGYTATPFANIFIDPTLTASDLESHDLFPTHFIKSLSPPENYVGSNQLFGDGSPDGDSSAIRVIPPSSEDYIPITHKSDWFVPELPESMLEAIRMFFLFRVVRELDGNGQKHSSMMINVSRFNAVQKRIETLVGDFIIDFLQQVKAVGLSDEWQESTELQKVSVLYEREYVKGRGVEYSWDMVRGQLKSIVESTDVALVNMRGVKLDYKRLEGRAGLHVIAIGGLALSRGLTLEGLGISYVLRNVGAGDTLLQMARWFGYRVGYENLCRVYLNQSLLDSFDEVNESVEELRQDLIEMEASEKRPVDFGLKVRFASGISITAKNKMRRGDKVFFAGEFASKHVQNFSVLNDESINVRNLQAAQRLVEVAGVNSRQIEDGALVWKGISADSVLDLLSTTQFAAPNFMKLGAAQSETAASLIQDYLSARADEHPEWTVAFPYLRRGRRSYTDAAPIPMPAFLGEMPEDLICRQRFSAVFDNANTKRILKLTEKQSFADASGRDLRFGMPNSDELDSWVTAEMKRDPRKKRDSLYLGRRAEPLLNIHLMDVALKTERKGQSSRDGLKFGGTPVMSISMGFLSSTRPVVEKAYIATPEFLDLIKDQEVEEDDEEY